jgi:CRP/FNR family transcriptional regulator, cyclic AMP receptor protein
MPAASADDLRSVSLFAALSEDELQAAAPLFTIRRYPKNAIVVSEGDVLTSLVVILAGRTRHFWRDEDGQEMDLTVLGPGEPFGHVALIGEPALISSITLEPMVVASIAADEFEALMARCPALATQVLKGVIRTVRNLIQRAKVFSMEGVYGRVVWLLQRSATLSDGLRVTDRLTHADIARRVGATREMVGQVLRDLAHGGYIAPSGGRFTILKEPPRRRPTARAG